MPEPEKTPRTRRTQQGRRSDSERPTPTSAPLAPSAQLAELLPKLTNDDLLAAIVTLAREGMRRLHLYVPDEETPPASKDALGDALVFAGRLRDFLPLYLGAVGWLTDEEREELDDYCWIRHEIDRAHRNAA